jgi:hypothetical protein
MLTLTQQLDEFAREMQALSEKYRREADEISRRLGDALLHTFGFSGEMLKAEVEKAQRDYMRLAERGNRAELRAQQAREGYWLEINSPVADEIRSAWESTRQEAYASGRVRRLDSFNRVS